MSRKREAVMIGIGILAGLALSGPAAAAADYLQAIPSRQTFYVNGQKVEFEAYSIHGNNFVKVRDIGKAVDFGVTYDGATNSVHIDPNTHYQEETPQPIKMVLVIVVCAFVGIEIMLELSLQRTISGLGPQHIPVLGGVGGGPHRACGGVPQRDEGGRAGLEG